MISSLWQLPNPPLEGGFPQAPLFCLLHFPPCLLCEVPAAGTVSSTVWAVPVSAP